MRPCLGRQLDLGLFPGLCLARLRWRAAAGGSELRSQPEPVQCPAAVLRPWRPTVAAAGPAWRCTLRSRRERPAITRALLRCASLAVPRLRDEGRVASGSLA